ncbi:XkdQ/YqbQ family protein, partial [Enterocloster bolteae]
LNVMIDDETAQDYDFTVSIDKNTYNQIKLFCENDDSKKRDVFMTKHTENINKWGVLQMSESLDKGVDGQKIAETYLGLYNRPSKSLSIKKAFGDIKVRAGSLIPVFLDVKDMQLRNYLLVEAVTHSIDKGVHAMDLTLKGAGISG